MGYSCTQKANLTLEQLMIQLQGASNRDNLGSNVWTHEDWDWFYEIGREQADGAITGSVRHVRDDGKCSRPQSFRINADGTIKQFPTTTYAMRWAAYQSAMGEYQRIHSISFMLI